MPGTAGRFPNTPAEMDALLGFEGERIADLPPTPGRSKVIWRASDQVKIVYEQHPCRVAAPPSHTGPHWHLNTPTQSHKRYLPGDALPNW